MSYHPVTQMTTLQTQVRLNHLNQTLTALFFVTGCLGQEPQEKETFGMMSHVHGCMHHRMSGWVGLSRLFALVVELGQSKSRAI